MRIKWMVGLLFVAGCHQHPDIQDTLATPGSTYSETLPNAESITHQYVPSQEGGPANSPAAYHVTPGVTYEDRSLDENLSGSVELADYYAALKMTGLQSVLLETGPYTVIALPNETLDEYYGGAHRFLSSEERSYLRNLLRQTILKGRWGRARIRRMAGKTSGYVAARTLAGKDVLLKILPSGRIIVKGLEGDNTVTGIEYPQSNGMMYISETPLSH